MTKDQKTAKKSLKSRPISIVFLVFLCGTILGIIFREKILALPGWLLTRSDGIPSVYNHIVVLMGDSSGRRAKTALSMWQKNPDAKIIFMQEKPEGFVAMGLAKGRDDLHADYFNLAGVPASHVINIRDCHTTSTLEEALCLRAYIKAVGGPSGGIIVVTDWYHSSRAGWFFDRVFKTSPTQVHIVAAAIDDPAVGVEQWWHNEEMFLHVFEEYIKWSYWRLKDLTAQLDF